MREYKIAVSCMTAIYTVGSFTAESLDDAIRQARAKVMPDQRGWHFYEIDEDEE